MCGLSLFEIIVLSLALAVDAFSVAASVGARCCPRFGSLRLATSFGTFQGLMPLLGALVGSLLYVYASEYDHWLAFGLLEAVGIKMLVEGLKKDKSIGDDAGDDRYDPSCGFPLIGLSVATSIDAFGAGISMQVARTNLWLACSCIAITAFGLTYVGAKVGCRVGNVLGKKAELIGGIVLILLGIKMLRI